MTVVDARASSAAPGRRRRLWCLLARVSTAPCSSACAPALRAQR